MQRYQIVRTETPFLHPLTLTLEDSALYSFLIFIKVATIMADHLRLRENSNKRNNSIMRNGMDCIFNSFISEQVLLYIDTEQNALHCFSRQRLRPVLLIETG